MFCVVRPMATTSGARFRSFGTIFGAAYTYALATNRPFVVETASNSLNSQTPAWIESIGDRAVAHPDTRAIAVWRPGRAGSRAAIEHERRAATGER